MTIKMSEVFEAPEINFCGLFVESLDDDKKLSAAHEAVRQHDKLVEVSEDLRQTLKSANNHNKQLVEEKRKLVEENERLRAKIEELESNLFFVGYTNPAQLVHVCDDIEPSGSYYPTTDSETTIPLFMLKSHEMRLMALTNDELTLDELKRLQNEGLFKK